MRLTHLKLQVVMLAICLVLDFGAHADTTSVVTSVDNQTTQPKKEKPKSANGQQAIDKQKRTSAKSKSAINPKSAAYAEKKKVAETVAYLKANQQCDSWFDLDGNTSDEKAYEQIKSTGYTKANAPDPVKKQIALGVEKCNQKYLVTTNDKPKAPEKTKSALETSQTVNNENKEPPTGFFGKVTHGVSSLFGKLKEGGKGSSNHSCTTGEVLMHTNGC
jgi:hypothetical protein